MTTTTLYRAVTGQELALIEASGWSQFPPRPSHRPPFVAGLNEAHARLIASDYKAPNMSDGLGFVARFAIQEAALSGCERKVLKEHEVYLVPDENLSAFNAAIEGRIEIIGAYGVQGDRSDILAIKEQ